MDSKTEFETWRDSVKGQFDKETPTKKLTAAERLAQSRGTSVNLGANTTKSVDKRVDPEALLEQYIKNNIVQKKCK